MSDSGVPKHWPFRIVEPGDFRVPSRKVKVLQLVAYQRDVVKKELVESINEQHMLDGWHGILFHYVIDGRGSIITGRPVEEMSPTYNREGIVIAASGSASGDMSSRVFCDAIIDAYALARKKVRIEYVE